MPKLVVPVDQGQSNVEPLSIEGVASKVASASAIGNAMQSDMAPAIASTADIGKAEQQFGNWQAEFSQQQFNKGIKGLTNTIYNLVSSAAQTDYNKQASGFSDAIKSGGMSPQGQYTKAKAYKDKNGVAQPLDDIHKDVLNKYLPGLDDPASKSKLQDSLSTLNNNKKLQVSNQVRSDEVKLSQSALSKALDSDIQSGLLDSPENLPYYTHQGLDRITSALEAGSITPEQAQHAGDLLRKGLYFGSLNVQNQKDPNSVASLLTNKTPEELNLTQIEFDQLKKQNQLALLDQTNLGRIQQKAEQEVQNANSLFIQRSLATGIESGQVGAAQLAEAYHKGKLDYPQYLNLVAMYDKASVAKNKKWETYNRISSQLTQNTVLSEFSAQQIDDHYKSKLHSLNPDGTVSMADKASIAAQYKGPVNSFVQDVRYNVLSNNPDSIKQAVLAYDEVNQKNPLVFSNLKDDKLVAYISALSSAYKYTNGLDAKGIKEIKDDIYNIDGRTANARMNQYHKDEQFSSSQIKNTIANMYPGGDPWYRSADYVNDDTVKALEPMLAEAYRITGDAEKAKATVLNKTQGLVGHSEVNAISRVGIDAGTLMFLPPEAVFDKARPVALRQSIEHDVQGILPKGVEPNQVLVGSDDLTINQLRQGQNPTYYLYYLDENNNQVLVTDKRWTYDKRSEAIVKQLNIEKVSSKTNKPITLSDNTIYDRNNTNTNEKPQFIKTDGEKGYWSLPGSGQVMPQMNPKDNSNMPVQQPAAIHNPANMLATTGATQLGSKATLTPTEAPSKENYAQLQSEVSKVMGISDPAVKERTQVFHATLAPTENPNDSPLLNFDFIEKAGEAATVNQIVKDYPADKESKAIIQQAITRMVGQGTDTWRVAQSMKLVNSVLSQNADPETYLKYGNPTTEPQIGDIVVTKNGAGLYGGSRQVNGQTLVNIISLDNKTVNSTMMVNLKDVRGFRVLPTPENFYTQQQTTSLDKPYMTQFNPYTGEEIRTPTGQERFNPYTGETYLAPAKGETLKQGQYFDPYLGKVKHPGSVSEQLKGRINEIQASKKTNGE